MRSHPALACDDHTLPPGFGIGSLPCSLRGGEVALACHEVSLLVCVLPWGSTRGQQEAVQVSRLSRVHACVQHQLMAGFSPEHQLKEESQQLFLKAR